MVDFPGEWNYPDPLRTASRRVVDAHRKGDASALEAARRELDKRTSDDAPPPRDLAEMCRSILMSPFMQAEKPSCLNCGGIMEKEGDGWRCPVCGEVEGA